MLPTLTKLELVALVAFKEHQNSRSATPERLALPSFASVSYIEVVKRVVHSYSLKNFRSILYLELIYI